MYHRVDAVDTDPWGICVAPEVFEEQIQYVSSRHPVITLSEAVGQVAAGAIKEQSVCITFDDGYADNYLLAKAILERYNCPATFFIPTAFIGTAEPFWWDELEYIFLHLRQLPRRLVLSINGEDLCYDINGDVLTESVWQQHKSWRWYETLPTDRCSVFLAVWERLRPLPLAAIKEQLAGLRVWAGCQAPPSFRSVMNREQFEAHFSNPLFSVGLHTHTHSDLGVSDERSQIEEIETNRRLLQTKDNIHSLHLAYPYGRYNDATITAVKQLKIAACFTTEGSRLNASSDITALGRYQVCNWGVEEFKSKLRL